MDLKAKASGLVVLIQNQILLQVYVMHAFTYLSLLMMEGFSVSRNKALPPGIKPGSPNLCSPKFH